MTAPFSKHSPLVVPVTPPLSAFSHLTASSSSSRSHLQMLEDRPRPRLRSGLSSLAALFRQFHLSLAPKFISPAQISPLCSRHNYLHDISTWMTHRHFKFKLTLDFRPPGVTPSRTLPFLLTAPLGTRSWGLVCIPPSTSSPHDNPSFNTDELNSKIHLKPIYSENFGPNHKHFSLEPLEEPSDWFPSFHRSFL